MFCKKCGYQMEDGANFYSKCGECLSDDFAKANVRTGDSSVNIGVGNLPNANIHIGDNINKGEEPLVYELKRTTNARLPFKASWAVFVGVVGFVGSIASIYSVLSEGLFKASQSGSWVFPVFVVSSVLIAFGVLLLRNKFVWLQYFGFEADKEGYVRFIRLKGKCPLCTGNLSVKYSGPEGGKMIGAICSRNPQQHNFKFDPTWLDEIS